MVEAPEEEGGRWGSSGIVKVLITGATGLLGTDLCHALRDRHELTGWSRGVRKASSAAGIRIEKVDITDPEAVLSRMSHLRPDVVIHAAAQADVDAAERDPTSARAVNVQGTENVARACASAGSYLIAISTDYVFDGTLDRPYREEDPPHPINAYGQMKVEAEQVVLAFSPGSLVIRISGLFGAARSNFVLETIRAFRSGRKVLVAADQVNSTSYSKDIAEAVGKIVEGRSVHPGRTLEGVLHLANSGGASRWDVARQIASALGAPESLIQRTTWAQINRPAPRPVNSRLDCSRWAGFFGAPLRPWAEALQDFLNACHLDCAPFP